MNMCVCVCTMDPVQNDCYYTIIEAESKPRVSARQINTAICLLKGGSTSGKHPSVEYRRCTAPRDCQLLHASLYHSLHRHLGRGSTQGQDRAAALFPLLPLLLQQGCMSLLSTESQFYNCLPSGPAILYDFLPALGVSASLSTIEWLPCNTCI